MTDQSRTTAAQPEFAQEEHNRVRRLPARGAYDKATIYAIVDAAPICHVGFAVDGQPYVIPTIHARVDDTVFFHGAKASRLLKHMEAGRPLCVTVTHLDGLVLARSVFHHSMNYRSAMLFGQGEIVTDADAKWAALEAITEHVLPGRWADARRPTAKEMQATTVVAMAIESASAKTRSGPPGDDEEDYALPVWAGVLPLQTQALPLETDPRLRAGIEVPQYIARYQARVNERVDSHG
ncbi:MAG: pyridoxamine 5'-phosphate oxidase family protein [Caldilineaceae bacterium]|nr:pyridoxamine 5'-phosphate oxidase family protein [Caldilineaceae bacterium]